MLSIDETPQLRLSFWWIKAYSSAVIRLLFHLIYSFRLKTSSVDGNADNKETLIESMNVRFFDRQSLCFYIREGYSIYVGRRVR